MPLLRADSRFWLFVSGWWHLISSGDKVVLSYSRKKEWVESFAGVAIFQPKFFYFFTSGYLFVDFVSTGLFDNPLTRKAKKRASSCLVFFFRGINGYDKSGYTLYTLIFLCFFWNLYLFFFLLSHYHELHGCSRVTRWESFRPCSGGGNGSAPERRLAFLVITF